METELSPNVRKVLVIEEAFAQLRDEYEGRPDVQHTIDEFLRDAPPASKALLYDFVAKYF